jgi:hypothetical protein
MSRAHAPWSVDSVAIVELVSVAVLVGFYMAGAFVVRVVRGGRRG